MGKKGEVGAQLHFDLPFSLDDYVLKCSICMYLGMICPS